MPVYPLPAEKASCRVSGCVCQQRAPRYPSDMTDTEWEILKPEATAVMAELRRGAGGRPMTHDLRTMVDAVRYMTKYGVEWRALPADFPPWEAVYAFFERWSARGLPQRLVDRLRDRLRVKQGRNPLPTAGSVDSQSVKAADTVGAASRGYDAGIKITDASGISRSTPAACCWRWWSAQPRSRTATAPARCWPCCGNASPRWSWSGLTGATPGGW